MDPLDERIIVLEVHMYVGDRKVNQHAGNLGCSLTACDLAHEVIDSGSNLVPVKFVGWHD